MVVKNNSYGVKTMEMRLMLEFMQVCYYNHQ